jgi:hypothetical protein
MRLKFTAKTMPSYAGNDGQGKLMRLRAGDECEVTDMVGKLLQQKYGANFEVMAAESKPAHAPTKDKMQRKTPKTKTKSQRKRKYKSE